MKVFFRILGFAPNLRSRIVKFFIFALLGVIFNVIYLGFAAPLFDVLFQQSGNLTRPTYPQFEITIDYFKTLFEYHFVSIIQEYGQSSALVFVCILIVIAVFMCNLFRYME